ncbi:MAG: apolipoprotein N-acyltransferase [Pseudomonadota bacterium]
MTDAAATCWPKAAGWCQALPRPSLWLLAIFAGGLIALGQTPFGFWPGVVLGGIILFWLWLGSEGRPGTQFMTGLLAGTGHFALALHWIIEPFLVDAGETGWMAPFALILLAVGLGLFWGLGFMIGGLMLRWRGGSSVRGGLAAALCLALGLSGGEFARSYVLTGFPWALSAYVWTDTPMAQSASMLGPYGLTLLTWVIAFLPGAALGPGLRRAIPVGVAAITLLCGWTWGTARVAPAVAADDRPTVRIVQTNVDQRVKWSAENIRPNFEMLTTLSTTPAPRMPEIVIWPETAVTFPLDAAPDAITALTGLLQSDLDGGAILTGSLRNNAGPDAEFGLETRWRNSLFIIQSDGSLSAPYDKMHLVPFGEYMPFGDLLTSLNIRGLAGRGAGIVPGEASVVYNPPGLPPLAALICYEMIFARETARAATGADWLVLITNDAWFGDWAGPLQHLAMAQMRAIELGLPVARSANAGKSALIDPYGRLQAPLAVREQGIIDGVLPDSLATTLYREHGDRVTTMIFLAFLLIATLGRGSTTGTCNRPQTD